MKPSTLIIVLQLVVSIATMYGQGSRCEVSSFSELNASNCDTVDLNLRGKYVADFTGRRMKKLKHVYSLNLRDNNLSEIPIFMLSCSNLDHVFLGSNRLTILPASLVKLEKLRSINLCDNNLSSLPDELSELPLGLLSIRRNNFDHIPPVVYKMEHLQYLDLSRNNIPSAEIEAYRQLHPNVRMYDENGRLEPLKKSAEKH